MSITLTDITQGDFADDRGCRSGNRFCANYPPPAGSYEAFRGELCSECIDYEQEQKQAVDCDTCDGTDHPAEAPDICPTYENATA